LSTSRCKGISERHDTHSDFCPRQLVTDLLRGNWCNGFWHLLIAPVYSSRSTVHSCLFVGSFSRRRYRQTTLSPTYSRRLTRRRTWTSLTRPRSQPTTPPPVTQISWAPRRPIIRSCLAPRATSLAMTSLL